MIQCVTRSSAIVKKSRLAPYYARNLYIYKISLNVGNALNPDSPNFVNRL